MQGALDCMDMGCLATSCFPSERSANMMRRWSTADGITNEKMNANDTDTTENVTVTIGNVPMNHCLSLTVNKAKK